TVPTEHESAAPRGALPIAMPAAHSRIIHNMAAVADRLVCTLVPGKVKGNTVSTQQRANWMQRCQEGRGMRSVGLAFGDQRFAHEVRLQIRVPPHRHAEELVPSERTPESSEADPLRLMLRCRSTGRLACSASRRCCFRPWRLEPCRPSHRSYCGSRSPTHGRQSFFETLG